MDFQGIARGGLEEGVPLTHFCLHGGKEEALGALLIVCVKEEKQPGLDRAG